MAPYALVRMVAPPGKRLISLAQNESLHPPSPMSIAAAEAAARNQTYPDPDWAALRGAIAEVQGLAPDMILCGAGSLDLIAAIARVYSGPGRAVLIPKHAYPFFRSAAQMSGARVDTAHERDGCVCVDALLDAIRPDTSILFLANPANPTGTHIPAAEIRRLHAALRDDILLVIDEAYGEYTDANEPSLFDLATAPNTVILRTFSKAYSLASARVGWGIFPPKIAAEIRKVLNPNNVAATSQAAAEAAIQDQRYMRQTVTETSALSRKTQSRLRRANVPVLESATNFLLLPFCDVATADQIHANLVAEGIFLRPQHGAGLPHALRMTLGRPDHVALATERIIALHQRAIEGTA